MISRQERGLQIVERGNQVKRLDASTYRVRSQNGAGSYLVVIQGSEYRCECPDWEFRGEFLPDKACKHIIAVRASQALRQSVSKTSVDLAPQPEECKVCKSSRIVKQGLRYTKNGDVQRYLCKDCGYRFVLSLDGFSKMKAEPKIVVSALDLFFKGLSLRKIADHIKQNYGGEFHNTAILKWIRKYTDLIKGYVETLNPKLSAVWHVDEMKQSMGEKKKASASRLTVRQGDYDAALDCSGCEYIFQVGESYYLITLQDCLTIMIFCEDCYGTYAKAAVSEN